MADGSSISLRPDDASGERTVDPTTSEREDDAQARVDESNDAVATEMATQKEPPAANAPSSPDAEEVSSTATLELIDDVTVVADSAAPTRPSDPDALAPGSTFGQFEIKRYVGGGGMGRVYEGVDRVLERKVAIKVLPRRRAQDEATVARFLNEAKSAARLNHENIAQVYLFGNVDGVPYIAFEYVDGVNLRDYVLERGVLDLDEAIDFILQAADALAHAAAHGVTHRDVKPSNIIVTPQKRVKLIDMGLARLLKSKVDDDLTESGVTLGTFDYISPEQARDPRQADARSDVYSLGCTFYYMLVGSPPFPEGTMLQKLLMHQGVEAPDVRENNPSIPIEIAAIVKKMMRKDPNERYQTPETLIADLRQVVDMLGLSVDVQSEKGTRERARLSRAFLRAIPAVFVIGALLAFFGVSYYGGDRHDLVAPTIEYSPFAPTVVENGGNASGADQTASSASVSEGGSAVATSSGERFAVDENVGVGVKVESYDDAVSYAAAELDSLYAVGYDSVYAKTSLISSDSIGSEQDFSFVSVASVDKARDAFGWRAHSLEPESESFGAVPVGGDDVALASLVVNWRPTTPESGDAATTSPLVAKDVRVVDGRGSSPNTFATLQSALSAPSREPNGQITVELRFNGILETPSISLVDKKVEILAAEGFQPALTFKPPETLTGGWSERMFLLDSVDLTLRGFDIDFTAPSQKVVASEWSLFESHGATRITANDLTLTISNMTGLTYTAPLHSNVAFFRSKSDASERTQDEPIDSPGGGSFSASLSRVFIRGEATVFDVEATCKTIEARDSGFVVSGPFLHYTQKGWVAKEDEPSFSLQLEGSIASSRSSFMRVDLDSNAESWSFFNSFVSRSILRMNDQPLATVYGAAALDPNAFDARWENCWSFSQLALLDVSAALRVRGERSEVAREAPLPEKSAEYEQTKLVDMNADAYRRLETLPPHLFSDTDFSNWILNPIHTASTALTLTKELADEIKRNFIDPLRE
ncbi:MAG: serine/threonine protein kinase [Thermoguttaceae bacterium]|nr:serine/threonine protein kinase [Thermoguttaceae bacterium]